MEGLDQFINNLAYRGGFLFQYLDLAKRVSEIMMIDLYRRLGFEKRDTDQSQLPFTTAIHRNRHIRRFGSVRQNQFAARQKLKAGRDAVLAQENHLLPHRDERQAQR